VGEHEREQRVVAKTEWCVGDDGLDVRAVGRWVDRKTAVVDSLARMFATGMKNAWPRRAYVELFAGPGRSWDRDKNQYVAGSAMRSLDFEFTDYVFIDRDSRATGALLERIKSHPRGSRAHVRTGDCNQIIDEVRSLLPPSALTLAFVDPTAWEISFDTVARLVAGRKVDLLLTFHAFKLVRIAHLNQVDHVNAFFGTDAWLPIVRQPSRYRIVEELAALYNQQLGGLGYLQSYQYRVPFRNSKNSSLYQLVGFSRDPVGVKFWAEASKASESGQRQFEFGL
jgi:three-Cys-motif partner protein